MPQTGLEHFNPESSLGYVWLTGKLAPTVTDAYPDPQLNGYVPAPARDVATCSTMLMPCHHSQPCLCPNIWLGDLLWRPQLLLPSTAASRLAPAPAPARTGTFGWCQLQAPVTGASTHLPTAPDAWECYSAKAKGLPIDSELNINHSRHLVPQHSSTNLRTAHTRHCE